MYGYIDPFYVAAQESVEAGHVWCDQPIYMPPRNGLRLKRVNPKDDRDVSFDICGRTADTFDHAPLHSMRLGYGEAAVVAKAKKDRPVIILGGLHAAELSAGRDKSAYNETAWVVPVYGADQFTDHMRKRISYYEFTNLFYLPALKEPAFNEGFARLDHAQPVDVKHLCKHRGFRLAPDALDALVEWFVAYSTGRAPDDSLIAEYRNDMLRGPTD